MVEIEVKVRLKDLAGLREALLKAGARLEKERSSEDNTFYDFPDRKLLKERSGLRLRRVGKKTYLTFKGTPQKSRRFKVREEYETEVRNEKQMRKVLHMLGLVPTLRYRKFRTVFRTSRLKICLDETAVGNFCEIEGQRNDIVKFAKSLGFSPSAWVKQDYVELIQGGKKTA